jgi:hypothetical protein
MRAKMIYAMVVVFVAFIAVGGGNVAYTNHVDQRRVLDQQRAQLAANEAARAASCELVVAFDDLYKETPPTTPAGVRVAEVWARYRSELGCG